jgi:hypothetical protein
MQQLEDWRFIINQKGLNREYRCSQETLDFLCCFEATQDVFIKLKCKMFRELFVKQLARIQIFGKCQAIVLQSNEQVKRILAYCIFTGFHVNHCPVFFVFRRENNAFDLDTICCLLQDGSILVHYQQDITQDMHTVDMTVIPPVEFLQVLYMQRNVPFELRNWKADYQIKGIDTSHLYSTKNLDRIKAKNNKQLEEWVYYSLSKNEKNKPFFFKDKNNLHIEIHYMKPLYGFDNVVHGYLVLRPMDCKKKMYEIKTIYDIHQAHMFRAVTDALKQVILSQ